jgi:outer membrane receptor protein involved in Fe transport
MRGTAGTAAAEHQSYSRPLACRSIVRRLSLVTGSRHRQQQRRHDSRSLHTHVHLFHSKKLLLPVLFKACVIIVVALLVAAPGLAHGDALSEIVVTSQRRDQAMLDHAGNIDLLDAALVDGVRHQHPYELMTRSAGVWVSRGSGQEHLTAMRSPVLTGAGSCGGFLFLEDGIPIRPAGFCNVNQLFEIATEQARSVEVIRGPGNALYGSNALHGTMNFLMPAPGDRADAHGSLELGSNEFARLRVEGPIDPESRFFGSLMLTDDGGFRDDSGYTQWKAHGKAATRFLEGDLLVAFTATDLDQETAGFIVGEDAYRDPEINRSNPNPEAFREASSQRLYGIWSRDVDNFSIDIRPYLRHSEMSFLQHFLPGQPLEENGHASVGALSAVTVESDNVVTVVGADIEWGDVWLEETQFGPAEGSDFLRETRPEGKHYDYDVKTFLMAPYIQAEIMAGDRFTFGLGLRAEYSRYDYDNRMLTGNSRDDGTPCGFGGCLYSRPADRSDSFVNFAPNLSVGIRLDPESLLYVSAARGFRAPQTTELYRLQSGQEVADLESERIDSVEAGLRRSGSAWSVDVSLFTMRKRDSVFRDAQGFNVSGARTRHQGLEASVDWQIAGSWSATLDATYARHQYDFDRVAARGETFVSGRDVDTAPRLFGGVEVNYDDGNRLRGAMQWVYMGDYFLDAENRFDYPGHSLVNLRATIDVGSRTSLTARINNLLDEEYADRADYAFGNYRYFPGRGREVFVEFRYSLAGAR